MESVKPVSPRPRIEGQGTPEAEWESSSWLGALPTREAHSVLQDVRRLVIVSPHPDDEVLGCGGLMQAAARLGTDVHVISVTDGEACYPDQPLWPAARLRDARRHELATAMRELGLDATHVTLLGLPDGGVSLREAELVTLLVAQLLPGDLVLGPWVHDAHPDHEATGRATLEAATARGVRALQYPVWAWHWMDPHTAMGPWRVASRVALCDASMSRKQQAMRAFATQMGAVDGLDCAPILPDHVTARFKRPYEVLIG